METDWLEKLCQAEKLHEHIPKIPKWASPRAGVYLQAVMQGTCKEPLGVELHDVDSYRPATWSTHRTWDLLAQVFPGISLTMQNKEHALKMPKGFFSFWNEEQSAQEGCSLF